MAPPRRIQLASDLQAKLGNAVFGFAVVDKINTKGKPDRRNVVVTSAFLFLVDDTPKKVVKRLWQWSDIESITKGPSNDFLIKVKKGAEPDQLLRFSPDPRNDPNDLNSFIDIIKQCAAPKLAKLSPPESLKVEDSNGTPLKDIARLSGTKVNAVEKRNLLQAQGPVQPPAPEVVAPPPMPATSPSPTENPIKDGFSDDNDDFLNHPTFHDRSTIKAPIAGGVSRRSHSPTGPVTAHPRWVPGMWSERNEARTPPPDSPWEMHYSKRTAEGRPYWYNTITGENTWSPPPEYDGRRSTAGSRRSPPWVPPATHRGIGKGSQLRMPDELRAEMSPPTQPLDFMTPARSPSPADILQRAAALSGTDVGTLVVAANDVANRRSMNYSGSPYQAIVV